MCLSGLVKLIIKVDLCAAVKSGNFFCKIFRYTSLKTMKLIKDIVV